MPRPRKNEMALRRLSGFKMTEEKILAAIPRLHDMIAYLEKRSTRK